MASNLLDKHESTDWELVYSFEQDFNPEKPGELELLNMTPGKKHHIPRLIFDKTGSPLWKESKALCGKTQRSELKNPSEFEHHVGLLCRRCLQIFSQKLGYDARKLLKSLTQDDKVPEDYPTEVSV